MKLDYNVLVISNDKKFKHQLDFYFKNVNHNLTFINSIEELSLVNIKHHFDFVFLDNPNEYDKLSLILKEQLPEHIIFFCENDDIDIRLQLIDCGITYLFIKNEFKQVELFELLDELNHPKIDDECRVLLIEDEKIASIIFEEYLTSNGINTKVITDSSLTLPAIKEFNPNVILTDYMMPDYDGLMLLKILKQELRYKHITVVFLSAISDKDVIQEAIENGAYLFLNKSITEEQLVAEVKKAYALTKQHNLTINKLYSSLTENQLYLSAFDQHSIISTADISGKITYVNDMFCKISGYSREELIGKNHRIVKSFYHSQEFYKNMWGTISSGKVWHGTICNFTKNQQEYWVEASIMPFLDEKGVPYKYVSVRTDITKLRNNERLLNLSQDFGQIGSWQYDISNNRFQTTEKFWEVFSQPYKSLALSYEQFVTLIHPKDKESFIDAFNACLNENKQLNIEHRFIDPDGNLHWLLHRGNVYKIKDKQIYLLALVQDITEKKELISQLDNKNKLLDNLNSLLLNYLNKSDFNATMHNYLNSLLKLTNSDSGLILELEFEGTPSQRQFNILSSNNFEIKNSQQSDSSQPDSTIVSLIKYNIEFDLQPLIKRVIDNEEPYINDTLNQLVSSETNNEALKNLNVLVFPIYYENKITGLIIICNDSHVYNITLLKEILSMNIALDIILKAHKHYEQREKATLQLLKSKEHAEQANKVKTVFLSSITHEFRTPLNAIQGFSQLLKLESASHLSEQEIDNIDEIIRAGNRLLELLNGILEFSKIEQEDIELEIKKFNFTDSLVSEINMIKPILNTQNISLSIYFKEQQKIDLEQLSKQSFFIESDEYRCKQVLANLFSNAIKFNSNPGYINIFIEIIEQNEQRKLKFSITNSGKVINQEQLPMLFNPFERLGMEGSNIRGSGVGLSLTKQLIELMQGEIGVNTDKDTNFWFTLPVSFLKL
ncbi:MAG: PAS domain-containing protein [Gammaproteobacteria bacterium]|nr:PAS domain-containing protein [Gammaproteobacteria bacterium]